MRIQCPGCKKNINLKEGSFPLDKAFSFSCPNCKHKVKVNPVKKDKISDKTDEGKKDYPFGEQLKKEILSKNNALPSIPEVLHKAKKLLDNPMHTTKELSKIISLDPAIAARVLKLANSAYFNFNPPIPTIDEACVLLGEQNLLSIIMVAEMSKMLERELKGYDIPTGSLFYHCIAVAVASDIISREKMPLFDLDAFSAGLLHDCGKLILNDYIYERKSEFKAYIDDNQIKCYEAETIMFGFSHAEIGYELLEHWKLPEIQTHAIGFHHFPQESNGNELSYILNVADYIALQSGYSASSYCTDEVFNIDKKVLEFLSIEDYELDEIKLKVQSAVEELTKEFSF